MGTLFDIVIGYARYHNRKNGVAQGGEQMKMHFRSEIHTETGKQMVEVWRDGQFIAGIYAHEEGMRIVSEHLDGVKHDSGSPPALVVKLTGPVATGSSWEKVPTSDED